jgi:hypothetical protein
MKPQTEAQKQRVVERLQAWETAKALALEARRWRFIEGIPRAALKAHIDRAMLQWNQANDDLIAEMERQTKELSLAVKAPIFVTRETTPEDLSRQVMAIRHNGIACGLPVMTTFVMMAAIDLAKIYGTLLIEFELGHDNRWTMRPSTYACEEDQTKREGSAC